MTVGLDAHSLGRRQAGNETYTRGLASALAASGDVDLVLYLDPGVTFEAMRGATRVRRFAFRRAQPRVALELPFRARRDRLDLLHVQYVVPPMPGVPVVTMVHDVSFIDAPGLLPARRRWRLRATVADAVRRSAVLLAPSEFSRERLLAHYDVPADRVVVTRPIVAPKIVAPGSEDPAATGAGTADQLAPLDLPRPYILSVGELQPRKNLARLVEAVRIARERGLDAGLVIAGLRGWRAEEVDAAIARHGAGSWTRVLGYVSPATLAALLNGARVVAHVSLYEGFGLPVLEAMAAGTPVVASRGSAIPEVAGDAALLVDPMDPDAIAAAIAEAASDEPLRATLIERGRSRVQAYSPEAGLVSTVAAYRQALGRLEPRSMPASP